MFFLPWEGEDEITRRTVRVGPRLASPKAGRSPIRFWRLAKTRLCSTAMISPRCRLGVKTRSRSARAYVSFHRLRTWKRVIEAGFKDTPIRHKVATPSDAASGTCARD